MEPTEIEEFSKQMQEGGESSMTHVSLVISILAVLVAMVTVLGHREHTAAVLMQSRAADQWNEYEARKMRATQISVAEDLLSLQPSSDDAPVQAKLGEYKAHMGKWQTEMEEDSAKAKDFEAKVDVAETKAARFDLSEAMLQIGVVLASITLLTRLHRYMVIGAVLGIAGLLISASALWVH